MKKQLLKIVAAIVVPCFGVMFLLSNSSYAAEESEEAVRANHPLGAYFTLWGDPFPALWGVNIAYNVYDFIRLDAGLGTDSSSNITATTFGVGAKAFVPKWTLSPVVGLNWSIDNINNGANIDIRGIRHGGNRLYGSIGLDWQTALGVNLGIGFNQSFASDGGGSGYLSAGFFL